MIKTVDPTTRETPFREKEETRSSRPRASFTDKVFLIKDDLIRLFQEEVALAKAELREGLEEARSSSSTIATAVILMTGGAIIGLMTLSILVSWIANVAGLALLPSLAIGFAVVALVTSVAGYLALRSGKSQFANRSLQVPRTKESVRRSKDIVTDQRRSPDQRESPDHQPHHQPIS